MPDHETPEFRPAPELASSTPRVIAAALAHFDEHDGAVSGLHDQVKLRRSPAWQPIIAL